jgi:uncharacterized protein (TIGR02646 family)
MIRVCKAPEPEWFPDWKKQKEKGRRSTSDARVENSRLRDALIDEQGSLCCYCGQRIDTKESHIEHFRPQSKYPELDTDYGNMHASCESKSNCGQKKGDSFDEALCISPIEVEEGRFLYTLGGEICPKDQSDQAATYMIEILKLNASALVGRRREVLMTFLLPKLQRNASLEDLKNMRDTFQKRDVSRTYQAFRQVLTCYIDQLSAPQS